LQTNKMLHEIKKVCSVIDIILKPPQTIAV